SPVSTIESRKGREPAEPRTDGVHPIFSLLGRLGGERLKGRQRRAEEVLPAGGEHPPVECQVLSVGWKVELPWISLLADDRVLPIAGCGEIDCVNPGLLNEGEGSLNRRLVADEQQAAVTVVPDRFLPIRLLAGLQLRPIGNAATQDSVPVRLGGPRVC